MSETNLQLFPGIFRSTVGGENPGFFLHSDGRVGIGNKAPTTRPLWSSDDADRNKLNVSGHTHIDGNLNVTGHLYGDGSRLDNITAVITGNWLTDGAGGPQPADIKYDLGNVGIGGAASAERLKVHGTVEATAFSVNGTGLGTFATRNDGNYNIHDVWLREYDDNANFKIYGGTRQVAFRTDGTEAYAIGVGHGYAFAWMYGGDDHTNRRMLLNTSGQLWCSNYGWLHDKFAFKGGTQSQNFYANTIYIGNSSSKGLRSVSGNYGTVQTTGGGSGGWEGYSIEGRYVFMSADNNSCGIYNDIDNEWMIYFERNSRARLYYNGSEHLTISNVNEFQRGALRVYGYEANLDYTDPEADWFTNGGSIQAETPYGLYGLMVQRRIRAEGIAVFSDKRIKHDFMEIDDTFALDKLRQLKPTSYRYIDKTRITVGRVLGFIAQEVAEVLPDAVSKTKSVIPNIQLEASIKKIDEGKFELTLKEPHPVTVGSILEIKAPDAGHMEVEVISVINDTTFTVFTENKETIEKAGDRVWVYGEYVDDFHNLDKNAIWTVATAALQEVDRQLQAEKEKVKSLEERLAALEAIVLNQ